MKNRVKNQELMGRESVHNNLNTRYEAPPRESGDQ